MVDREPEGDVTVIDWSAWRRTRRRQHATTSLRRAADDARALREEFAGVQELIYVDIAPGRDVAMPPLVRGTFCALCFGQKRIWEPALDGSMFPVVCEGCRGTGLVR